MDDVKVRVVLLTIFLFIPASNSLKTKRRVLKSLKDRLHARLNVSVAETGFQDKWQRSALAVTAVASDKVHLERLMQDVLALIGQVDEAQITEHQTKFL